MKYYERLKELRKERKETQAQTAEATGILTRQYQRYESGENEPTFKDLCAFADHFGVTLDYLAGRTDAR